MQLSAKTDKELIIGDDNSSSAGLLALDSLADIGSAGKDGNIVLLFKTPLRMRCVLLLTLLLLMNLEGENTWLGDKISIATPCSNIGVIVIA